VDGRHEYGLYVPRGAAVDGLRIEGFEVANQPLKGICVDDPDSRDIVIRGNVALHIWEKGVDVRGAGHCVEDNVIYMIGNDQEAMVIRFQHTADCTVMGNAVFLGPPAGPAGRPLAAP
jgi:hypothetical protein